MYTVQCSSVGQSSLPFLCTTHHKCYAKVLSEGVHMCIRITPTLVSVKYVCRQHVKCMYSWQVCAEVEVHRKCAICAWESRCSLAVASFRNVQVYVVYPLGRQGLLKACMQPSPLLTLARVYLARCYLLLLMPVGCE